MKYMLGGIEFAAKYKAQNRVSCILNSYELGETLSDDDFAVIADLLPKHPRSDDKLKPVSFYVGRNFQGGRSFYIIDKDGYEEDFSIEKCFNPGRNGGPEWHRIRMEIFGRDRACLLCGLDWDGGFDGDFHVHHINGKSTDNAMYNLALLCRRCHYGEAHPGGTANLCDEIADYLSEKVSHY